MLIQHNDPSGGRGGIRDLFQLKRISNGSLKGEETSPDERPETPSPASPLTLLLRGAQSVTAPDSPTAPNSSPWPRGECLTEDGPTGFFP